MSRDCNEYDIPSVPIEMPSLSPTVLNRMPTIPAASTPSFTLAASVLRCMLHDFPSYHTLEMPICGLFISSSVRPVAYSIACDAPCDRGCVTRELYLLRDRSGALISISFSSAFDFLGTVDKWIRDYTRSNSPVASHGAHPAPSVPVARSVRDALAIEAALPPIPCISASGIRDH